MSSPDLLVTGASGHFGQRVLHHLLDTLHVPAERIAAASRKPGALAQWHAKGVTTRAADFDDRASLTSAFAGVERLLLISTDALDRPGHRLAQHEAAIEAAAKAGVKHVVYTSMPKPEGSPLLLAPDHAGSEAALAASALPQWTVLRNNWYFENLFMALPTVLSSGKWFSAAGEGRIANIARDDLARAAATVLAATTTGKTKRTLTGAKAYTTGEIAQLVGQTVGKPIEVIQVPVESLVQGMVAHGLPEPLARLFASFDTNTAAGGVADVTGDFTALTGTAPLPLPQWLAANKPVLSGFAG
jgi:NAD(P)H dehydrogenase (quinone)